VAEAFEWLGHCGARIDAQVTAYPEVFHRGTGDLFGVADVEDPSVVDENVNPSEVSGGLLQHSVNLFSPGNIGGNDQRGGAAVAGNRFEPVFVASDEHSLRAFPQEGLGDGAANTGTGSGHNGGFVLESLGHGGVPVYDAGERGGEPKLRNENDAD